MLFRRLILITIFIPIVLLANVDYNEGSLSSTEGNLPPDIPTLIRIFDNAIFNAYPPPYVCNLSFKSTDPEGDDIQYKIQWDTDPDFGSPYTPLETELFPSEAEANATIPLDPTDPEQIYYWKACAKDKIGPGWTAWSEVRSFTMDMEAGDVYWYQVTGAQFEQGIIDNVIVEGNMVKLTIGQDNGSLISHPIVFTDLYEENPDRTHWDGVKWTKSSGDDDIKIQIEYKDGSSWILVPGLPGNLEGFSCSATTCKISIQSLDEETYGILRLKALFTRHTIKSLDDPTLLMWALGKYGGITGVSETEEPLVFSLNKIEPNPFTNKTEIRYQIPKRVKVSLKVFDIIGRSVVTLVNDVQKAGYYTINWSGTNRNDVPLPSGVYFLRMEAGEFMATQKMLLLQ